MKMKINKACDLCSIFVLPPHSSRSVVVEDPWNESFDMVVKEAPVAAEKATSTKMESQIYVFALCLLELMATLPKYFPILSELSQFAGDYSTKPGHSKVFYLFSVCNVVEVW
ncbi:hypothetical protein ACLB2K_044754 [Fragaria x ananassa]